MDTLLNNAVQSIQIGVEDYQSSDSRRILSAVRNITSGVLLLFKERLKELSPLNSDEVLLKQYIKPIIGAGGSVEFVGKGNKTVDTYQIEERFKTLGIEVDWKRFRKIIEARNNIEHYCTSESEDRLKELLSDCFLIIRNFVAENLKYEPIELLGEDTWSVLLKITEVYKKELEECRKEFSLITWDSETLYSISENIRCNNCYSQLVKPTNPDKEPPILEFHCSSCGEYFLFEDIVSELVSEYYEADHYIAMTDGGEPPTSNCHECGEDTYVIQEDQCVRCGTTRAYKTCPLCGEYLSTDEQEFNGLCGYHYHTAMKDD